MRSKKGNNSGQKSHCNIRYNRSHNSDSRRNNKNSNQVNSFAKTNQRVLLDVLEYRSSAHMYQGNGFRSFSNNETYGNTPHQQVEQVNVSQHLNTFNVQDHFHNHATTFGKLLTNNHSYSGSALKSFGTASTQEQFGTLNINNPARSYSNSQEMNYPISTTGRCNSRERFGESSGKVAPNNIGQGNSYSKRLGLSDGSYSQTNKMCEVFNDVLGEKPPESNSGKSSNHLNTHSNPYGYNISPFDSPSNITTRNQNYSRYKWRRDDRPSKSKTQQGNSDTTWESGTNYDRHQRSRDRHKRPNHHSSDNRQDADKDDQLKESTHNKQQVEDTRKSTDAASLKESRTKDGQVSNEKAPKPKKFETTVAKLPASNTSNASNNKSDSHNNNKNSNSKEKESIREKATAKEKKSKSEIGRGKPSPSSTSSSGSDTDCMIEEEDDRVGAKAPSTPLPVPTGDITDSIKSKSKAIMQSSSSATARPSHPANMGISPNLRKDQSSDKKKKKEPSKKKDAPPSSESEKKSANNVVSVTSSSNTSTLNATTATTTVTSSTASTQNVLKKPLSKAAILKLITPRSRKDQQRVEQLMKEYSEKRDKAHGSLSANSTALSQSSSLESPFGLEHLDLASLDFKVLKTDIPEELSEVINKVFDFSSTEKNPIVLDDDDETARQARKGNREHGSSRKRKYSENFGSRKKRKDQDSVSMSSNKANTDGQSSSGRCVEKSDSSKGSTKEIVEGSQPEEAVVPVGDSIIPSISPAAASHSPGHPSPSGILETLLQLSLKEDEIQGHIANLDLEIQALQGMIVDLSHKLNSKKHHRDMMMSEEKRLKAFRIQALRASVDSNKMSPDLHQQFLNCMASSRLLGETFISEESSLNYQMEDQDVMPTGNKIINIVPQLEGSEDYELAGRDDSQSKASACNSVPSCSPDRSRSLLQTSKPMMSPPPMSMENSGRHVRYLGTLNDISHLFRKQGSINSEPNRGSELASPGPDAPATMEDSGKERRADKESTDEALNDILKIKSELADRNSEN